MARSASNNSLQTGNTQQRTGHAAAVIQFSNAFVSESRFSSSQLSGLQTLIYCFSPEDPDDLKRWGPFRGVSNGGSVAMDIVAIMIIVVSGILIFVNLFLLALVLLTRCNRTGQDRGVSPLSSSVTPRIKPTFRASMLASSRVSASHSGMGI